jgi:hypothetical protein
MKKFVQYKSCCVTIGMQFPPEVDQIQVGYTMTVGNSVMMGPYFGRESLDYALQEVSPFLEIRQKADAVTAICQLFEP